MSLRFCKVWDFLALGRICCCCGLNGAITKCSISFKTVIIKEISIHFYCIWEHLVPQLRLNLLMRRNVSFFWFYEIICLGLFVSLTEREEDEVESVRDIRSVWHVFELGVMTQARPVTTTLQSGKSASLINFQKSTHIKSFSKHSHTF